MRAIKTKLILMPVILLAVSGTVWARTTSSGSSGSRSTVSAPMPWSQGDQPVKIMRKDVVCILGGFETKGKTADECKKMGGRVEESPELVAT